MKCHEFESRFHALLDDRRQPAGDAQLAEHASTCPPCCQLMLGQQSLLAGLQQAPFALRDAPPLADDFAQRVVARFQSEPVEAIVLDAPSVSRQAWKVVAWLAASAAALALGVSIFFASSPNPQPIGSAGPDFAGAEAGPLTTRSDLAGNAGPDKAMAASRPRRGGSSGNRSFIPRPSGGYGIAIADMAATSLPDAVERIEEVERFAPGIRPIRVSFAMLWDALWRTIPGLGSSDENDPKAFYFRLDSGRLA